MLEIDGSTGEGGGQILRTSIALSAVTQTPVLIKNIRRNRPRPGLAAQHITGIRTAGMLCNAQIEGIKLGSTKVTFSPGRIAGGNHKLDIGTAGSITLVLQACLPVALHAAEPTVLELAGGTDVKYAPPLDYFRFVTVPLLRNIGADIELMEIKRGYYPKGGGRLVAKITPPVSGFRQLLLEPPFEFGSAEGVIHCANLPDHIPGRIAKAASNEFKDCFGTGDLELEIDIVRSSFSPGVGIALRASSGNMVMGASALGEKGVLAEKLGKKAVLDLHTEVISGASVDVHAADQLLPYLAFAGGAITARGPLSAHARTNIEVVEKFYKQAFSVVHSGDLVRIEKTG